MFEYGGKKYFAPGDKVWVYIDISPRHAKIAETVVNRTILDLGGVSYYTAYSCFNYHEGNTFATKEEARAWAEENREGWLKHVRDRYAEELSTLRDDLRAAEEDRDDAMQVVADCQLNVDAMEHKIAQLEEAIDAGAVFTIEEVGNE